MKMKKLIILLVAFALLLTGCAQAPEAEPDTPDDPEVPVSPLYTGWGVREFLDDVNVASPVSSGITDAEFEALIERPELIVQTGAVTYTLEEALYDGRQLHTVFTITPNDPDKTLIMPDCGNSAEDPIAYPADEPGGADITYGEKAAAENKSIAVTGVSFKDEDALDGMRSERCHADGSVTLYVSEEFLGISEGTRDFHLSFYSYPDGADDFSSAEQTITLSSCGEWTVRCYDGEAVLAGASVSARYARSQFEISVAVRFKLPNDISAADIADWNSSFIRQFDADTGDELCDLGAGMMLLDANDQPLTEVGGGDTVEFIATLPSDCALPEKLELRLVRVFGDSSEAGKVTISLGEPQALEFS